LEPQGNPPPKVIRHSIAVIGDFLPEDEWNPLLREMLASEARFRPSGTHDARADYRQSLVLNPPVDLVRPVVDRVRRLMPKVLPVLRVSPIVVGT